MLAKNKRGYTLATKNIRWWLSRGTIESRETPGSQLIVVWISSYIKQIKKYFKILTIFYASKKKSMSMGCNIWMICLELNWFVYDLSEFVQTLRSSVLVVFNNFLLIRNYKEKKSEKGPVMNPPDRRQGWEAPSHSYSNWTFLPTTISPL